MAAHLLNLLILCVTSFSLLVATSAHAQTSDLKRNQEIKAAFTSGIRSEQLFTQKLQKFGLTAKKNEILLHHYRSIVRDQEVIDRIYQEVVSLGVIDRALKSPQAVLSDTKALESIGSELFTTLSIKGLRRLEFRDQRVFVEVVSRIFNAVPARTCKQLLVNNVSPTQQAELEIVIYRDLSDSEMDNYLNVLRRGLFAEVKNFPNVKTTTETQRITAEKALGESFLRNISSHPRSSQLGRAIVDLHAATDNDACDTGRILVRSLLDMKGLAAEWQTRVFIESSQ